MMPSNPGPGSRRRFLAGLSGLALSPLWRRVAADAGGQLLHRTIPSSGERLPVVGLAAGHAFQQGLAGERRERLARVLSLLFNLPRCVVDASPRYGRAESLVARVTRRGGPGEGLFLATRLWAREFGENLRKLQRLEQGFGAGRLDLVQVDNLVEWEANLRILRDWKRAGRLRHIGVTHHHRAAFPGLERILKRERVDFVQLNFSLAEPEAEQRLLPMAADRGVAVIASRPFAGGYLFRELGGRPLPGWAAELGCSSWRCLLLKYVLAHPAVTCAITDTADPLHLSEHLAAGLGPLPDAAQRRQLRGMLRRTG